MSFRVRNSTNRENTSSQKSSMEPITQILFVARKKREKKIKRESRKCTINSPHFLKTTYLIFRRVSYSFSYILFYVLFHIIVKEYISSQSNLHI